MTQRDIKIRRNHRRPTPFADAAEGRGFTLLEVLVATAILGTAVASLFGLLSGSLGNMQRLGSPSRALLLGQSRMNELLATGVETGGGTTMGMPLDRKIEGRWDDQYRWEALATHLNRNADITPGQVIPVRVTLDVFWKTSLGRQEKKLSFETVQLWQEPAKAAQ